MHTPIVQYLWNLSSGLVCAITAQAACAEGKSHPIWALNGGHSSISIGCTTSIVPQTHSILNIFLQDGDIKHVIAVHDVRREYRKNSSSKLLKYTETLWSLKIISLNEFLMNLIANIY